jgi:hypothetical protein
VRAEHCELVKHVFAGGYSARSLVFVSMVPVFRLVRDVLDPFVNERERDQNGAAPGYSY